MAVDKVDKIMHGMQLGSAGMHNQIKQGATAGSCSPWLEVFVDQGLDVYGQLITGTLSAKARPSSEGVIAETKQGERARVYPTSELRSQFATAFSFVPMNGNRSACQMVISLLAGKP